MAKILTTLLLLAIFAGLILLAMNSWRHRRREQSMAFSEPVASLGPASAKDETAEVQYVATTIGGEPLNRVTAYGLGFRGRASITANEAGVVIDRRGERSLGMASRQIESVNFAQVALGRAVEKDGLVAINWIQDTTALTTVLRFQSAADRNRILRACTALSRKAI